MMTPRLPLLLFPFSKISFFYVPSPSSLPFPSPRLPLPLPLPLPPSIPPFPTTAAVTIHAHVGSDSM